MVSDDRCLHACRHEQHLLILGRQRAMPRRVANLQVLPRGIDVLQGVLAVDPHSNKVALRAVQVRFLKILERTVARTTSNQPWQARAFKPTFFEQLAKSLAAPDLRFFRIRSFGATFDEEFGAYQRVPPIWPFIQSWPKRYSSNQTASSPFCRRRIVVLPSCFSQTTMTSGRSVMASTRMSEWVVTMS